MLAIHSQLVVVKEKVEWFPEVIQSEVPPKLLLVVIFKVHSNNSGTSARPRLWNLRIWFFFLRGAARRGALASVSNYVNSRGASAAYLRG